MKFRVCLRVETPDDSKELLGRPDAAFLPNMGGRGYIQVGNDILTAVQVARAGGDYSDDRLETLSDIIWLDEEAMPRPAANGNQPLYSGLEIAEALGLSRAKRPPPWWTGWWASPPSAPSATACRCRRSPGPTPCPPICR